MTIEIKLSGFEHQNKSEINSRVNNLLNKIYRMMKNPEELSLNLKIHKTGGRTKFTIRARIISSSGTFNSHAFGWDIMSVVQDALDKLEREVKTKHDKKLTRAEKTSLLKKTIV